MIPFYNHQEQIIKEDKEWFGIFQGTGSGKTRTALELSEGNILVICPKQQFLDDTWQDNADKFGIKKNITTISKERFRRDWKELKYFDTVIIDECHTVLGVMHEYRQRNKVQIPKTSQLFEAVLNYIRNKKPKRFYMCSATPVSKPMHMWAIAKLFGTDWNFDKFRQTFYTPVQMGRRQIWIAKTDQVTKQRLALLVQRFGYTGALEDFVDVPEQTHKEVIIELTGEQKKAIKEVLQSEADPLQRRGRMRTIENGILYDKVIEVINGKEEKMMKETKTFPSKKIDYILEKAVEFKKLLIFAQYTGQIHEIEKALKKEGYNVSTLTGKTKDRGDVIKNADAAESHIVVAQSGISAGYELPSFRCIIYASKDWRYVNYKQSLGRLVRVNNLKKNLYIHLIVKGADEDCHKSMMSGEDFQEKLSVL